MEIITKTKPHNPITLKAQQGDVIYPNECVMFSTGTAVSIANPDIMGVLVSDFTLGNSLGIIDSDFQGEIRCGILNQKHTLITVPTGKTIGSLFFMPIVKDVEIIPLRGKIILPSYATPGAAGMDIFANISIPLTFYPGETLNITTGFKIVFNRADIIGMLVPRSSMGVKCIGLANTIGIIQPNQDEIVVPLINRGRIPYTVNPKDKICQMIFMPIVLPDFVVVKEFSTSTARSKDGFGSTGR